jgi:type IX secretion system PorP/SprF family membrane protein
MKRITIIILLASIVKVGFSQDIHFSQANMTPLELNPANAGTEYDIRAILNYRTQWNTVSSDPFVTMMAGYDMNFKKSSHKLGYFAGGIFLFNDKAGDSKMTQNTANLAIAYHVNLSSKSTLGLGVQGGYFQRSIDYSNLTWGNQYDGMQYDSQLNNGETSNGGTSIGAADFAGGLTWTYRKGERYMAGNDQFLLITGLSLQHINKPKTQLQSVVEDPLYYRWVGHVNGIIGVPNSKMSILPSAVYMQQGALRQFMVGANFGYKFKESSKYTGNLKGGTIGIGAEYRMNDAFIITSFLEIANYTIGLSYDMNTSSLSDASNSFGAFEVALRYVSPSPFSKGKSKSRFR